MIESIKEQLLKIKALAERGVAGERDSAACLLERLMKKHGLTLADLNADEKEIVVFTYRSEVEKTLLCQVIAMITNPTELRGRLKNKKGYFLLTKVEAKDVLSAYQHYRIQWRREQEKMLGAFIQHHRIYRPTNPEDKSQPMTMAEIEDLLRHMGSLGSQDWHRPAEQLAMGGAR